MSDPFRTSLALLLREALDGSAADAGWFLNPGDRGLLASLEQLSATSASARPAGGGASIAAHVAHLTYGLELLNRWSRGETPFADADYSASWRQQAVSEQEWRAAVAALREQAQEWVEAVSAPRELDHVAATTMLSSAMHLTYHLGAIRQIDRAAAGPPAGD